MRTSYNRGSEPTKKSAVFIPEPVVINEEPAKVDNSYDEVMSTPEVSEEQRAISSMIIEGYSAVKSPVVDKPKTKKSKKGLIIGVILAAVIVVGSVFAFLIFNGTIQLGGEKPEEITEPYEPQYDIIAEGINDLYVDEEKSAIADGFTQEDVDAFYDMIDDAESNGEDVSDLEDELDTISDYLKDVAVLSVYEDVECDLAPDEVVENLLKVKSSADEYSVLGLKDSVYARVDALIALRQEYLRIKSELLGVSDYVNFDSTVYVDAINAITHIENHKELSLIFDMVSTESEVAKIEASLSTIEDPVEKEEAEVALENAKIARDNAVRAWKMYTGELVEEPVEEALEDLPEVTTEPQSGESSE